MLYSEFKCHNKKKHLDHIASNNSVLKSVGSFFENLVVVDIPCHPLKSDEEYEIFLFCGPFFTEKYL